MQAANVDVAVLVLEGGEVGFEVGTAHLGGCLAWALRLRLFFPLVDGDGMADLVVQVLRGGKGVSHELCVEPGLEVVELLESRRLPFDVFGRPSVVVVDDEGEHRLLGFQRPEAFESGDAVALLAGLVRRDPAVTMRHDHDKCISLFDLLHARCVRWVVTARRPVLVPEGSVLGRDDGFLGRVAIGHEVLDG